MYDSASKLKIPSARERLAAVLGDTGANENTFSDSDGLISFVNMASTYVTNNEEYKTGRFVCDKVGNFFASMREKVFVYLVNNPGKVLPGDTPPTDQWNASVTHFIQAMLTDAGGLASFKVMTQNYSHSVYMQEFSTSFVKLIFDTIVAPAGVVTEVTKFIEGVGSSLRFEWSDKSKEYQTAILGQCHEAIPLAVGGDYVYFPKVKYYKLKVTSSQKEFTTPCSKTQIIKFNFDYEYYVTALKASVLDDESPDYVDFVAFLDEAQTANYKNAKNNLDAVLNATSTTEEALSSRNNPDVANLISLGQNLRDYPRTAIPGPMPIQAILNHEGS